MRRPGGWTAVACAAALGTACVGAASGDAASPPVLGAKAYAPSGSGFGTAHPKLFHNGGDPSGLVSHIKWKSWGAASAYGTGKNALFKPGGGYYSELGTIKLRAYDLGTCPGSDRRAYRRLKYRVPSRPGGKLGKWQSWSGPHTICQSPASASIASRAPSRSEQSAIRRVAMKACKSDAGPCRWHGARVSTKSARYAWANVTNEGFSGVLVRRTSVNPKRFKVVGVQGGGIGECSYWRKRAPRSVLKDLKVYGLLDAATGDSGICG